jgi:DNA-directed RNA polymerase subunit beta'
MSINIDVNNFDALRIGLSSPEKIRSWSNGEVKKPETINYRTLKPEKDGLFCERIFGPTKDWECYCGKYKRVRFKGIICERCGVEVTRSSVRRERMGHIELAAPVSHIWFFKGVPSRMGYILDLSPKDLEKVLYFDSYIITSIDKEKIENEKDKIKIMHEEYIDKMHELHEERMQEIKDNSEDLLKRYQEGDQLIEIEALDDEEISSEKDLKSKIDKIMKENEKLLEEEREIFKEQIDLIKRADTFFYNLEEKMLVADESLFKKMKEVYGEYFEGGMGAESIKELFINMDCAKEVEELKTIIDTSKGQKRNRAIKRLKIISSFVVTENRPEYMVLDVLPVIPPDLRPMVQLDGGRFATSDLNDLYRRVINRNNRLKKLLELDAPEIIINNEKRMLQEAVDALFDNGRRGRAVVGAGNRPLKSLSDMLKGKQGRFRQNLLGKRVDYSGRSVIVVNPNIRLDQCGLPKQIALELFKPFVMKKLVDEGFAQNIKSAKIMVERGNTEVWDILEEVIKNHPVLLNRAPTLHRLGIQAFMPILVEGKAVQIHPLVCPPFNADFDGDQMAVHVPLSNEAKAEAIILMLSSNNILSPASGEPVATPSQDMVLGVYYLTSEREKSKGKEKFFHSFESAILNHDLGFISLHTPIHVKVGEDIVKTTAGRIIFNGALPKGHKFINKEVSKKELISIISECIGVYPNHVITDILDGIKTLGFTYSTKAGLTIGIDDIIVPPEKKKILEKVENKIEEIEKYYEQGLITDDERHQRVIQIWSQANEDVAEAMEKNFDKFNPIYMMATSGARGNIKQLRQLAGMRGLVANARGDILDRPIKSNFREGLTVLEYFLSTHGARQGLADTALRTADSGYLTRRLVDVAQDTMIRINDCGTDDGVDLYVITLEGEPNTNLIGRLCQIDVEKKGDKAAVSEDNIKKIKDIKKKIKDFDNKIQELEAEKSSHEETIKSINDSPKEKNEYLEQGKSIEDLEDSVKKINAKIKKLDKEKAAKEEEMAGLEKVSAAKAILARDEEITEDILHRLVRNNIEMVNVRSVLTCEAESGVCQKCYGRNLATSKVIDIGEAVGTIAAQSIGEPGTQLTMRTFHTGGVASTVIQRSIKSPVSGTLVIDDEMLEELKISKEEFNGEDSLIEVNIEHIPHKLIFQVQMERGDVVDVIIPKGEVIQLNRNVNLSKGQVFAKLILTAKRKRHVHKHEKTFEGIDITSGLPKVVELFEARRPKEHSFISEVSGKLVIEEDDSKFRKLTIVAEGPEGEKLKDLEKQKAAKEKEMADLEKKLAEDNKSDAEVPETETITIAIKDIEKKIQELLEQKAAKEKEMADIENSPQEKKKAKEEGLEAKDVKKEIKNMSSEIKKLEKEKAAKEKEIADIKSGSDDKKAPKGKNTNLDKIKKAIKELDAQIKEIRESAEFDERSYLVPIRTKLRFNEHDDITVGDQLTEGPKNPHDILKVSGVKACAQYLVREVQNVYKSQGVEINDKHIEIIVRQMLKKITVLESGDSSFLPGQLVDRLVFEKENEKLLEAGKRVAQAKQNLMGITKASLATDSFLICGIFPGNDKGAHGCCH